MLRQWIPVAGGYPILEVKTQNDDEQAEFERFAPASPPDGYVWTVKWTGQRELQLHLLRVEAGTGKAVAPADDGLDKLTDADLHTQAAEVGVKTKGRDRVSIVEDVRKRLTRV